MVKSRLYANISAMMSLIYLGCIPALVILLFVNWKLALCVIPLGLATALLAKHFNRLKLRELYGRDAGTILNEFDWKSGRHISTDPTIGFKDIGEMVSDIHKIRDTYGHRSEEEEEAMLSIHRLLNVGQGEWGTVIETDGKEYPCVTFRIASYPHITLSGPMAECRALLTVTMEPDRSRIKTYSLNKP
jgi:hypothetical protein